jgi:hypothetical protein
LNTACSLDLPLPSPERRLLFQNPPEPLLSLGLCCLQLRFLVLTSGGFTNCPLLPAAAILITILNEETCRPHQDVRSQMSQRYSLLSPMTTARTLGA